MLRFVFCLFCECCLFELVVNDLFLGRVFKCFTNWECFTLKIGFVNNFQVKNWDRVKSFQKLLSLFIRFAIYVYTTCYDNKMVSNVCLWLNHAKTTNAKLADILYPKVTGCPLSFRFPSTFQDGGRFWDVIIAKF